MVEIERGMIFLWFGSTATIPAGYILCDGNGGTPDLRDKFLIGAGGAFAVDAVGGAPSHTHTFTGDGHFHTTPGGTDIQSGATFASTTDTSVGTGTTDSESNIPPYHALAYIMKT